ncbi:TIGR02281 family clan AA aspartic protease [Sphingomonas sp. NIBR02145]|uniref:retropepsin-like aspartic protease family protein n=1 Tax=Sphingomonas sp. NIBR02145 TaxID=3014784 RepID=UPI0022B4CF23|nr:TIGR02281 family clan AA aspartic protease [Sphingomonas sp. NIBR02145]WHU03964.1 TIGR02281 family clan AA aspartic protease [Sphingomonas sp. NIBR02145]
MTDDRIIQLILLLGALMLALRALSAQRISLRGLLQTVLLWGIIGVTMVIVLYHRQELGGLLARASEKLGYEQQSVVGDTVRIKMSPDGHFWARVQINGVERRMLVDSGATITAISRDTAEAADVKPALAPPVLIETANGTVQAQSARAEEVAIGPLSTQDLPLVVGESFGDLDVLGMNFLSRLKSWRVEDRTLILEPRKQTEAQLVIPRSRDRE